MSILVIAEAGVNHNGDIKLAKKLVDAAVEAKADVVKFQSFKANKLSTKLTPKADYQAELTDGEETQYQMLKRLELTEDMHSEIIGYCRKRKINFLSTAFDITSLKYLLTFDPGMIKIPSGEITNLPLLRYVGGAGKQVIMSTGMAAISEIGSAIEELLSAGLVKKDLIVLHCTSEYPAPMEDVNLLAMQTIKKNFDVEIGYSDHTEGIEVAVAAAALGAKVIEKHFTIDRSLEGPDHQASLEPKELADMVKGIRNIEKALGNGVKKVSSSEAKNRDVVRKSIVALKNIKKGERLTEINITTKRPGFGISPMYWDSVLGSRAKRNFSIDELIEL